MNSIYPNSSYNTIIQNTHKTLLKINKTYSTIHQNLLSTLSKPELLHPVLPSIPKPSMNLIASLINSSKSLIELDNIHKKVLEDLNQTIKVPINFLQFSILFKQNLGYLKSIVQSNTNFFTDSLKNLSTYIQSIEKKYKSTQEQFLKLTKSCLASIVPQTFTNIEKWPECDPGLIFESKSKYGQYSESSTNYTCDAYKEILLNVHKKLLDYYKDRLPVKKNSRVTSLKFLPRDRVETESPERINRITRRNVSEKYNYGQTTEKTTTKVPSLKNLPYTTEDEISDGPVTETRIKPCENNSNFSINFENPTRRRSKHNSISVTKSKKPSQKIPKNISISFSRQKKPKIRQKSLH